MRHLDGLRIRIEGEYQDAFLYGPHLFLLTDELLEVVDFPHLVDRVLKGSAEDKVLYRYAFLKNDAFYDEGHLLHDFFGIGHIKTFLLKTYEKARKTDVSREHLARSCVAKFHHKHPGALHLEIYRNNVFVSGERGTFAQAFTGPSTLSDERMVFEFPAVHISANVGSLVYFACGHNGLIVTDFERARGHGGAARLSSFQEYEERAISTELAYSDFVCRTIANAYTYRMNSLRGTHQRPSEHSPEEKVRAFAELEIRDSADEPVLANADYVSTYGKRIVRLDKTKLTIFHMDYKQRMAAVDKNTGESDFFRRVSAVELPEDLEIGPVYSGFQTVFGLVLDTDAGTAVLDDDPRGNAPLRMRTISKGENVKVRHYYRSRNYSHLVVSVKEDCLDVFSDLTNYFFPRARKNLRVLKPFGSKSSGALVTEMPFNEPGAGAGADADDVPF